MEPSPLLAEDAVVGRPPPPSHDGCRNPDAGSSDGTGALLLVLGYLRLPELLAFQRVSRFFRDAVAGDGLLWRRVAVQSPLSGRLTDDALLRITSRAEGKLESLALMDCWKITDDGLMQVVDRNPGIAKVITFHPSNDLRFLLVLVSVDIGMSFNTTIVAIFYCRVSVI